MDSLRPRATADKFWYIGVLGGGESIRRKAAPSAPAAAGVCVHPQPERVLADDWCWLQPIRGGQRVTARVGSSNHEAFRPASPPQAGYVSSTGGVHEGQRDSPTSMPCSYTATSRNGCAATVLS